MLTNRTINTQLFIIRPFEQIFIDKYIKTFKINIVFKYNFAINLIMAIIYNIL